MSVGTAVSLCEEDGLIGRSRDFLKVKDMIRRIARFDTTVMITGETGTGKELIARAIHNRSRRAARAFIRVNCAAIPPSP